MNFDRNRFRQVSLFFTRLLLLSSGLSFLLYIPDLHGQILTLTPSLSVSERYDDNIFETSSNTEDDFVTTITPGIHLRYKPTADDSLDLDYRFAVERFVNHSDQNQISHLGTVRFSSLLTRLLSIRGRDTLVITEEQQERIVEIEDATGLRPVSDQSRQRTIRNRGNADLDVRITPRSSIGLLFDTLLVDVNVPDELDEFRYTLGLNVGYLTHIQRRSRVNLGYAMTRHHFSTNPAAENEVVTPLDASDFDVHAVTAGFRHAFTPKLSGDAAVGYSITSSNNPDLDDETAIVANFRMTRALRTGQIVLGYRRSFTSGGGEGGTVLANTFFMTASAGVTPKITASFGANVSFFNFRGEGSEDRLFWTLRPALTYQMLRFWDFILSYNVAYTNFDDPEEANRLDQRLNFTSRFTLREPLFLELTYRYASRNFSGSGSESGQGEEFNRNQFFLTLIYAPEFFL